MPAFVPPPSGRRGPACLPWCPPIDRDVPHGAGTDHGGCAPVPHLETRLGAEALLGWLRSDRRGPADLALSGAADVMATWS